MDKIRPINVLVVVLFFKVKFYFEVYVTNLR